MSEILTSKQPFEEYAINFDFTPVLGAENIASAVVIAVDQDSLENVSETLLDVTKQSNTNKVFSPWVQNGITGHNYIITCRIVGSAGSQYELDGILPVQEYLIDSVAFNTIPFSIAQFRVDFKEFVDEVKFPNPTINFWAGLGYKLMSAERWGDLITYGLELFVAHNVALQFMDQASVNSGGAPGVGSGVISNQSAGGVTIGLDTTAALEEDAGNYNLTVYGTRLKRLIDTVGCGGAQLI